MITASEYHQMGEAGIIRPEERVELINGEIITLSPIGSKHAAVVIQLLNLFRDLRNLTVSSQSPVRLGNLNEPEPDIALLKRKSLAYFGALPYSSEIALIIEVSDSTILYDTTTKLELYANAGILNIG